MVVHPLNTDIAKPERFTYPFAYEPHPLCQLAAQEVQQYIATLPDIKADADQGKMFGVLVVEMDDGRGKMEEAQLIPHPQTVLAMADRIIGSALSEMNAAAEDTLTATQVAKTFNMTVWDFNAVLSDMGIQYRRYGRWNLSDDLQGRGLTEMRTHISYSLKGERKVKHYMTWTLQGLRFLNAKLGYPNF